MVSYIGAKYSDVLIGALHPRLLLLHHCTDQILFYLPPSFCNIVLLGFAISSATGPTIGVIAGGIIVDKFGGYKVSTFFPFLLLSAFV